MQEKTNNNEEKMDAKITKKRLSHLLSYDWIKIVAIAAAVIFAWTLIFSVTATKITAAQQFVLVNHYSCYLGEGYGSEFYSTTDFFSYEVIERRIEDLQASAGKSNAYTVLDARLAVGEGDVMFIPDIDNPDTKTLVEGTGVDGVEAQYEYKTYVESFLMRYFPYMYDLDDYFRQMEEFLIEHYGADWQNGELDETKVAQNFRARVKKDNRFKKEAQIQQGIQDEKARIESYKEALIQFNGYLQNGTVELTQSTVDIYDDETLTGNFSLNICPSTLVDDPTKKDGEDGGHMFKDKYSSVLEKKVYYYATDVYPDATNPEITHSGRVKTAINMNMVIFRYAEVGYGFQYESLLYINDLIADCIAEYEASL